MFLVARSAIALTLGAFLIAWINGHSQPVHTAKVTRTTTVSAAQLQAAERTQVSWRATMQQTQTQIVAEQQRRIAAQRAAAAAAAAKRAAAAKAAAEAQARAAAEAQAQAAAAQARQQAQAQAAVPQQPTVTQQQPSAPVMSNSAPARPAPAAPAPASASGGSSQSAINSAFAPLGSGAVSWGQQVARCESGYNPGAVNSSSGAEGLFQFMPSTWAGTPEGRAGESVDDPTANAQAAAWMYSQGRQGEWSCNP